MVDRTPYVIPDRSDIAQARISEALASSPALRRLGVAFAGRDAYLVGGAVRDLLLGVEPREFDVALEGDAIAVAGELDPEATLYPRFGTATIALDGGRVDLAMARTETYAEEGALPDVRPAPIDEDLGRRDFSVNAIAVALGEGHRLHDPHAGVADLNAGVLRVLHDRSLRDDPTRALRGARYATRLRLEPEPATLTQIRTAPLEAVSASRISSELRRISSEPDPLAALELLESWGLAEIAGDTGLARAALELLGEPRWAELEPADVLLAASAVACARFRASAEQLELARRLSEARSPDAAQAIEAARGASAPVLLLARALGAQWIDAYVDEWRLTRLEISGDDLIAAGVEPGSALGAGLSAAMRAKLAGEADDREAQLAIALSAARG